MNKKPALVLFTGSFPYFTKNSLTEISFLQNEVEYLAQHFSPIIVVPTLVQGKIFSLPSGLKVDDTYSKIIQKVQFNKGLLSLFTNTLFFEELWSHPRFLLNRRIIRSLAVRAINIIATRDWVIKLFDRYNLNPQNTLFYTYWLNNTTLGIGLAKELFPGITIISRAHGGDLYANRRQNNYYPFRPREVRLLDHLFLISEHGKNYITGLYPWAAGRCEVSRLGVRDFGIINTGSDDGVFRIVSCSSLMKVKRVDLFVKGLAAAAKQRPDQDFTWDHFGDGPRFNSVKLLSQKLLPSNVNYFFHGIVPNNEVISYYKKNPVDLFVNVSSSEGIPVSIMEASCFGIPIMATAVGGTPEIVSSDNGVLLDSNPIISEISTGLLHFISNPELQEKYKVNSRKIWHDKYDADRNYLSFANRLSELVNTNSD